MHRALLPRNDDGGSLQEVWHCPCYDRFRVREWEGETFLFNPASGDTHLLNRLSMEILGLLRLNRLSADSLIIELKQLFGPIESALERDQLIAYLHQFEAMGLIVSHHSCD